MTSDDGGTGRGGGAGPLRARRVAETTSVKSTIEAHYHLGPSALIREAPAAPPGTRPGSRVSTRRGGSANPAKRTPTHTHTQKRKPNHRSIHLRSVVGALVALKPVWRVFFRRARDGQRHAVDIVD